ncbi:NUDIX domain-containing protein [Nonomuraea jabiensis]|uniref:NUDIX domain-containing protein n=1 Tax=Nonomuraea jabiensis TaxID=882448 RepID=UPI003D751321
MNVNRWTALHDEIGETPSQCAVRETEEETGVRVEPVSRPMGGVTFAYRRRPQPALPPCPLHTVAI